MFALIKMNEIRKDRLIFNINADGHYRDYYNYTNYFNQLQCTFIDI